MHKIAKAYKDLIHGKTSVSLWYGYGGYDHCLLCKSLKKGFNAPNCSKCPCGPGDCGCVEGNNNKTYVDLCNALDAVRVRGSSEINLHKVRLAAHRRWQKLEAMFNKAVPEWKSGE